MSWVITLNDLDKLEFIPERYLLAVGSDNEHYRNDAITAFKAAKRAGLVSATISGGRTPSPYGGPDSVVLSIVGFDSRAVGHAVPPMSDATDFKAAMKRTVLAGPDDV